MNDLCRRTFAPVAVMVYKNQPRGTQLAWHTHSPHTRRRTRPAEQATEAEANVEVGHAARKICLSPEFIPEPGRDTRRITERVFNHGQWTRMVRSSRGSRRVALLLDRQQPSDLALLDAKDLRTVRPYFERELSKRSEERYADASVNSRFLYQTCLSISSKRPPYRQLALSRPRIVVFDQPCNYPVVNDLRNPRIPTCGLDVLARIDRTCDGHECFKRLRPAFALLGLELRIVPTEEPLRILTVDGNDKIGQDVLQQLRTWDQCGLVVNDAE